MTHLIKISHLWHTIEENSDVLANTNGRQIPSRLKNQIGDLNSHIE